MVMCVPIGSKCNICGLMIPEGDDMCGNGYEPGKVYKVPVQKALPQRTS